MWFEVAIVAVLLLAAQFYSRILNVKLRVGEYCSNRRSALQSSSPFLIFSADFGFTRRLSPRQFRH
jgi:hypothetical protein